MSWPTYKLDELGFVGRGRSRHRPRNDPSLYGGQIPFVQTADISGANYRIESYSQTYNEKGLAQSKLWEEETLCITIAGENTAKTAVLNFPACFPDSIVGFVPHPEKANLRFVKHTLDLMKNRFRAVSMGATQDNLSLGKILSFDLPLPDLSTQNHVAGVLSAYDDLIENNRRRIALLEEAARLIYREWFVHFRFPNHENTIFENGLPVGWEMKTFGDLFEFLGGFAFKSSSYSEDGKYGVVTIKNVHDAKFIQECPSRVDQIPDKVKPHCKLTTGDILLSLTGNVGRACAVVGENYLLNQRVAKIEGKAGISKPFVYWSFSNSNTTKELENLAYGVAQLNLSPVKLSARPFVKPDKEVIDAFGVITQPMFENILSLQKQNQALTKARDLLLPRLMDGRIAV